MKLDNKVKKNIIKKKDKLNKLSVAMKDKFVGIDNIIDDVISSITPFYLFPEAIERPIVINLWGMTGTGKTSLVESIVDFLNLNHSYVKFDIGEYCDSGDKLRNELSSKIKKLNGNSSVILFDEFQLGRTIDEAGKEIDRNSLRPIWELIDSGIIYTHNGKIYFGLVELIEKMKKCIELGVVLDKDGYVIKGEEIYNSLFGDDYAYVPYDYKICKIIDEDALDDDDDVFDDEDIIVSDAEYSENVIENNPDSQPEPAKRRKIKYVSTDSTRRYWGDSVASKLRVPRFVKKDMFDSYLYEATPNFFNGIKDFKMHRHMFEKTLPQLIQFINEDFVDMIEITKKVDFSQSIIFCLGNLDELYKGDEHNISPDEDADKFHELSLYITMPQVKKALCSRFRIEKIGSLGNTHYIYPTLNESSYKTLIQKYLDAKKTYLKENFGLDIEFDNSINKILYAEGVYPSQGTRPLLSTFNSMIESYMTKILTELSMNFEESTNIKWVYENENYTITVSDEDKNGRVEEYNYHVDAKLERLRESDSSNMQSLVAVHEAGHALSSCITTRIAPTEVLSKTADLSEGVCKHDYKDLIYTKNFLLKELEILLAGLEAEKLIFGDDYCTIGAGSDLTMATKLAFSIVKRYGMGDYPALMSSDIEADNTNVYIKFDDGKLENVVFSLLKTARENVKKLLSDNKEHLLILSERLIQKSKIETDEIKEILKGLKINWIDAKSLYNFKEVVYNKIKELDIEIVDIKDLKVPKKKKVKEER